MSQDSELKVDQVMPDLEQVFDAEIMPLARQLIQACEAKGLPVLVATQFCHRGVASVTSVPAWADGRIQLARLVVQSLVEPIVAAGIASELEGGVTH